MSAPLHPVAGVSWPTTALFTVTICFQKGRERTDIAQGKTLVMTLFDRFTIPDNSEAGGFVGDYQRECCEAYGIPLKAFGNWRAKFKAEPQLPPRQTLYRRGGLSHARSHGLSHGLSRDMPGRAPSSHLRARVVVRGSAKQTNGRYFGRRCGRIRASPR
jgi:hypothetical protein